MTRKVQQIDWTNRAGDCYEIDLIAAHYHEGHLPDRGIFQVKPNIALNRFSLLIVPPRQMLPACGMVLLPDRPQNCWIADNSILKSKAVHRNTIHSGDYSPKTVVILVDFRREYQHGMVKGEVTVR